MTNKFRLPSKEEFEKLGKFKTKYDNKRKGRWFLDEETGERLFLPCECYRYGEAYNAGIGRYHWSSTSYNSTFKKFFFFDNSTVNPDVNDYYFGAYNQSIRLVSDKPFEGSIHVAGLYWKPENEKGYYAWNEI